MISDLIKKMIDVLSLSLPFPNTNSHANSGISKSNLVGFVQSDWLTGMIECRLGQELRNYIIATAKISQIN